MILKDYLGQSLKTLEDALNDNQLHEQVEQAIQVLTRAAVSGDPILVCGNGGSAADAQHIACELVGRFLKERRALNVICLSDNAAIMTAISNDYSYEDVFARQVEGYGKNNGVLWALSTSGKSPNVLKAVTTAKSMGLTTIAMTGSGGGKLGDLCDILINVPSTHTPHIQQLHLCLYHYMCYAIESALFKSDSPRLDN